MWSSMPITKFVFLNVIYHHVFLCLFDYESKISLSSDSAINLHESALIY